MQLSVKKYKAKEVSRGANLDLIDVPLNNSAQLKNMFDDIRSLESSCVNNGLTLEQAQRALLNHLGGTAEPLSGGDFTQTGEAMHRNQVSHGQTEKEKAIEGMTEALLIRSGMADDEVKKKAGKAFAGGGSQCPRRVCGSHL